MTLLELAQLLEETAVALRQTQAALDSVNAHGSRHLDELDGYDTLSVRTRNVLAGRSGFGHDFKNAPIVTVGQLCAYSEEAFAARRGCGSRSTQEVRVWLASNGLSFANGADW